MGSIAKKLLDLAAMSPALAAAMGVDFEALGETIRKSMSGQYEAKMRAKAKEIDEATANGADDATVKRLNHEYDVLEGRLKTIQGMRARTSTTPMGPRGWQRTSTSRRPPNGRSTSGTGWRPKIKAVPRSSPGTRIVRIASPPQRTPLRPHKRTSTTSRGRPRRPAKRPASAVLREPAPCRSRDTFPTSASWG